MKSLRPGGIPLRAVSASLSLVLALGFILNLARCGSNVTIGSTGKGGTTNVTIDSTGKGGTTATVESSALPPIDIDRKGVHEPPTPTPGPITPVYPIPTSAPAATPRPG